MFTKQYFNLININGNIKTATIFYKEYKSDHYSRSIATGKKTVTGTCDSYYAAVLQTNENIVGKQNKMLTYIENRFEQNKN